MDRVSEPFPLQGNLNSGSIVSMETSRNLLNVREISSWSPAGRKKEGDQDTIKKTIGIQEKKEKKTLANRSLGRKVTPLPQDGSFPPKRVPWDYRKAAAMPK